MKVSEEQVIKNIINDAIISQDFTVSSRVYKNIIAALRRRGWRRTGFSV